MLKPNTNIADFVKGIDMLSDETSLPKGACRDAKDIDIDVYGNFRSRAGFTKVGDFPDAHSLWGSRDQSFGLFMNNRELRRLVVQNDAPASAVVLNMLTPSERASFFEYDDRVFFTNGYELGVVTRRAAWLLGVMDPPGMDLAALTFGTMAPGNYSLAYSFVMANGEESGLSEIKPITLLQQGGVEVLVPPVATFSSGAVKVRVYCTPQNGDVLYQVAEFYPRMSGMYDITDWSQGKQADNVQLHRMPAGDIVRVFNGRLMVSSGTVLRFSQPFRFGLTSRRHDFVQFESPIYFVEPVAGGVFVGVRDGAVYFLAGSGPNDFTMSVVSTNEPVRFASTLVPPRSLGAKLAEKLDSPCCIWLGTSGYSIGLPDGTVMDSQADRISLDEQGAAYTTTLLNRGIRQVVSVVESSASAGPGAAVDSSL